MKTLSISVALCIAMLLSPTIMAQSRNDNIDSIFANVQRDLVIPGSHPGKVGLVLSGGGAKGIAHVGVIKALEDNDIPIDYVAGTSMGAIVGSLYSCGWTPEQMLNLFTSKEFLGWSMGAIAEDHQYFYYKPTPTPQWLTLNVNFKKNESIFNQIIPTSIVSPLPMNIEFLRLYGPYSEQCSEDFNKLFVPFRCVASDVYHKKKVVFSSGSLGDAVRASMSFPLVYRPIEVDSILLYDGGIYDNFPVNVMHEDFDPGFIIGVSVSGADSKPTKGDMYSQVEDMIIQNNDYSLPEKYGIKIQVPVLDFGVLQFDKASTIYDIGYKTGLAMVDSIKKRTDARRPMSEVTSRRKKFAADTPQVYFDSISIQGLRRSPSNYLKYLFTHNRKMPVSMSQAVEAYYRAVTDGSLSDLVPTAEFGPEGHNILTLSATPKNPASLGVGGWVTTSSNSFLYASAGYHTLGLNSLDMSLSGWVGQSYFAGMFDIKFEIRARIPSCFVIEGVLSRQRYYDSEVLFYKNSTPLFASEIDNFLRLRYVWAMGLKARGYASLGAGYMSDTFFLGEKQQDFAIDHDKMQYWIGVFRLGVESSTLNNEMYPSQGWKWQANADLSLQASRFCPEGHKSDDFHYRTKPVLGISALWKKYFPISSNFSLGLNADGAVTIQKLNQNYINTLVHSPAFGPTPATKNYFNIAFRADNYISAGVSPVWLPMNMLQVRGDFYAYAPLRGLRNNGRFEAASYDGWFKNPQFIGEVAVVYNLPFASISLYGNYLSSPSHNWNFGLSFGLFFQAPKLLGRQ
ncbi:MAG: patatin-like phospholipase family protein [Candidatus Amulumruptor caecigallinarius]|nr:patatin-like phospholipase family protein [Candidatus Amulumruptor caecigallinarius]